MLLPVQLVFKIQQLAVASKVSTNITLEIILFSTSFSEMCMWLCFIKMMNDKYLLFSRYLFVLRRLKILSNPQN